MLWVEMDWCMEVASAVEGHLPSRRRGDSVVCHNLGSPQVATLVSKKMPIIRLRQIAVRTPRGWGPLATVS